MTAELVPTTAAPLDLNALEVLSASHRALTSALRSPFDVIRARRAQQPDAVAHRTDLETRLIASFDTSIAARPVLARAHDPLDDASPAGEATARSLTRMAATFRLPAVYRWAAREATADELRTFIAIEGGPDHGFDDLVAACQMGLPPGPKTELARNYWDEMGGGDAAKLHTVLYREMVGALDLDAVDVEPSPTSLRRDLLMSLLVTRRDLQPQMLGALALVELQAGPRCAAVVRGLARTGLADAAGAFYSVHADVDPVHGRDWVERAIVPLVEDQPWMAAPIVQGGAWRCAVDADFYEDLERLLLGRP